MTTNKPITHEEVREATRQFQQTGGRVRRLPDAVAVQGGPQFTAKLDQLDTQGKRMSYDSGEIVGGDGETPTEPGKFSTRRAKIPRML